MSAYLAWIECLTVALGRLFYALIILGLRFVYYLLFSRLDNLLLIYVREIFLLLTMATQSKVSSSAEVIIGDSTSRNMKANSYFFLNYMTADHRKET